VGISLLLKGTPRAVPDRERRDNGGVDRGNEEREDWRRHRSGRMRAERHGEKRRAAG
jgi:hypothetical protein